jgi:hypothetical protein
MSVPLAKQLECARAVLEQMRSKNSRWIEAQEAVVATVERALLLEEVSREVLGKDETQQVEVVP